VCVIKSKLGVVMEQKKKERKKVPSVIRKSLKTN